MEEQTLLDDEVLDDEILPEEIEELEEVLAELKPSKRKKKEPKDTVEYVNKDDMWQELKRYYESLGDNYDWEKQKVKDKSIMPDIPLKLYQMIDDIAEKMGYLGNFINYCVDEETEALTQRGWLKHDQITTDDIILAYDMKDKKLKWSSIKGIFRNHDYDGLMHKWTITGMDALVTPGHKFITVEDGGVEAEYIKTTHHITLMGKPEKGSRTKKYDDEFVRIVGWAVTEGSYKYGNKSNSVTIYQNEGFHADEIRECLNDLEAQFTERLRVGPTNIYDGECRNVSFNVRGELAKQIIEVSPQRILSNKFILDLTYKQRMFLVETMMNGDGWIRKNKPKLHHATPWSYGQKCKKHTDAFLMLCTLAGLSTSTVLRENKSKISNHPFYSINIFRNPMYFCRAENVNFHGGRPGAGGNLRNGKRPNKPTQYYKGTVWCPETEYGTFVCRRGAYIYTSHNSYLSEMRGDGKIKQIKAIRDTSFKLYTTSKVEYEEEIDGKIKQYFYDKRKKKMKDRIKEPDDKEFIKDGEKYITYKANPFGYFSMINNHSYINRIKKEKQTEATHRSYQEHIWSEISNSEEWRNVKKQRIVDADDDASFVDE